MFMPVGTQGTVKGISPQELLDINSQMILGNTYHLMLRPGEKLVEAHGGLPGFTAYPGPFLTASGGFQVMSLGHMRKITEEGVVFKSHLDGSMVELTPERSIQVQEALGADPERDPQVIGIRGNRTTKVSLRESVAATRQVPELVASQDFPAAMELRGHSFTNSARIHNELISTVRTQPLPGSKRIAIMHAGGLAPGMNTAARAAVRLGITRGYTMLGIENGFDGLRDGQVRELTWREVEGLTGEGGAVLGTRRTVPAVEDLYAINRVLEEHRVDALMVIGGFNAYEGAWLLHNERSRYPAFTLPILCIPASIDNNLPGSELSIGADTALNVITDAIDKIKMSGSAAQRCFVVETMGRYCGYLALMGGLSGGAERVYLHEEGITLDQLNQDVHWLNEEFSTGRRLFLAIRNENANEHYTTDFISRLLEEAGGHKYDVRQAILGHIQQGGAPSPFDRLLATRLVSTGLDILTEEFSSEDGPESWYIGLVGAKTEKAPLHHMHDFLDPKFRRPRKQWWLDLRKVQQAVAG